MNKKREIKNLKEDLSELKNLLEVRQTIGLGCFTQPDEIGVIENVSKEIREEVADSINRVDYNVGEVAKRIDNLYDHFNLEYSTEEKGVIKKKKDK